MSDEEGIRCGVCHHNCLLKEGQTGICRARRNEGGRIRSLNYGVITGFALDPIEKKPLKNFYPGSYILSVGSFGCNLRCSFCQNHEISQQGVEYGRTCESLTPEELRDYAVKLRDRDPRGNLGVAYTYNEPLVGPEFVLDTAKLIREAGLKNVLVTNGCIGEKTLSKVLPYIDGMNIDLKCFTEEGYERLGGDLSTVKDFIREASKVHIELTSLIVPGLNEDPEDMKRQCAWIAGISEEIPLHITRFFPQYHMRDAAPTDLDLMGKLKEIAAGFLKYVYLGNV